ncbi:MBL fold metallo-hydrolase [Myxosarcina sp. GI1]|uniref:MBL fold metallo-hydrolase n=1 Tax=Myxosarcina sp. GI1 TaxID=1541065 RepID=UPI000567520D|nr:MBL fold metallo-hydrolase [Myxosarcina sp. GI1]
MFKLLFLGSGSAFTVGADNFQSNMLLINDRGNKLLIDCGSDIRFSLYEAGLSYLDITDIYISHLHSDHAGGLEYIGFSTKFDPQCKKPNLYLSKDVGIELWQKTLSGGMSSIAGDLAELSTFFNVSYISSNNFFVWQNTKFDLVKVSHVDNSYYLMPSYGVFFQINKSKIFITTDTQLHLNTLQKYYKKADLIFQDCEIGEYPTNIHAHYQQLLQLPKLVKNKMWLYGYQPGKLPDARQDNFLGFVKRGQIFNF